MTRLHAFSGARSARLALRIGLLCLCALMVACSAKPRAVVVDRSTEPARPARPVAARPLPAHGEYVVVRGDTLYGIAFRHGLDFRDLAQRNRIPSPYTIYPGQRLRLGGAGVAAATRPATQTPAPTPPATRPPASTPGSAAAPSGAPRAPAAPTASAPAVVAAPAPPAAPVTTPVASGPSRSVQGIGWRWPASGQIVGKYVVGDPTRQGLNIAGSAGQAVNAAADGEVVYSGSGLIGYGELVIIKHSDAFLSAYGHNRKRLVSEGQRVKAGQQIAEMGRSGAARDMLHFEIRNNGKPVDPLPFLPAR